ncbi:hypothetical protein SAE02_68250 [Skermanella aerolata]|uniref:Methane monooxygenase n=1 Tax=Skermanella aerolata TaxID=393310 RepID=A0A512E1T1_9PROT|nr:methane monooxygenase [Skermanella aerolata]KJB91173.1 methane monooxygenase [Skermanella aerolata KACC 11604]GEO42677.1 hypothetical protein SAE02_68250 [Skermanella aerolata]
MALIDANKRGLTDPERAAEILKAIPAVPLDSQRRMNYFVPPRWKRLSEYEILTLYCQPTPDWVPGGLDWGDWTQKFHGGRPSWGNEFTELRTTDWHRHRDPSRRWHAPYVKDKSEDWRYTTRFLEGYSADGAIRTMEPFWRDEILDRYWGALLFNEYGLFNAHSSVLRDCLSETIRTSAAFAALDKLDIAQMIQLERTFIAKLVPVCTDSTDAPKRVWLEDPVYRGARKTVEELWRGIHDCNEILWSVHAVYDSLFGQFVRREFFQRLAPYFGDTLTPFFVNQAQTYYQITRGAISDLYLHCLADDPEFSSYNRRFLRVWTGKWLPHTIDALGDFVAIYQRISLIRGVTDKASIEESVERVICDWAQDYADRIDFKVDRSRLTSQIVSRIGQ